VHGTQVELFEFWLDFCAVSDLDHYDRVGIDVLLGDAQPVGGSHLVDLGGQVAVVIQRQSEYKLTANRRRDVTCRFEQADQGLGERVFSLLQLVRGEFGFANSCEFLEQFVRRRGGYVGSNGATGKKWADETAVVEE